MIGKKAHRLPGTFSSREKVLNATSGYFSKYHTRGCGGLWVWQARLSMGSFSGSSEHASRRWWEVFHLGSCLMFMCLILGRRLAGTAVRTRKGSCRNPTQVALRVQFPVCQRLQLVAIRYRRWSADPETGIITLNTLCHE